jgi:hypothetical protein
MRFDVAKRIGQANCCKNTKGWVIEDFQDDIPAIFGCSSCGFTDFLIDGKNGLTRATLTNGYSNNLHDWLSKWFGDSIYNAIFAEVENQVKATYEIIKMYLLDEEDSFTQAPDWDELEFLKFHWPECFFPVVDFKEMGKAYVELDSHDHSIRIIGIDGDWVLAGKLHLEGE